MTSAPKNLGAGRKFKRTPCGEIPVDWACVELGKVAEFVNGKAFKPTEWRRNGMPIIRIANLNGSADFNYCTPDIDAQYRVGKDDLLFSWSGSRGTSFGPHIWRGPEAALNQHIFRIILNQSIHKGYCYHALRKITQAIEQGAHGSAGLVHITKSALAQFCVPLPPLPEQQRIADILESVDMAIEKTKAVIEQTKLVRKGLTQQLLTRGIPGRHKRFKKTPMGEIPEEWEVMALGSCLREPIRNGYSPVCSENDTGKWLLSLSAVSVDGFDARGVKCAPMNDERVERARLDSGDIVVSRSNTSELVGLAGLYEGNPENCFFSDLLMRVRVNTGVVLAAFADVALRSRAARHYFAISARGTSGSMKKIDRRILENFPLVCPPLGEQREILSTLMMSNIKLIQNQRTLAQHDRLREALMKELLMGRVRTQGYA